MTQRRVAIAQTEHSHGAGIQAVASDGTTFPAPPLPA